jgi:CRISPR/Cas system CSM-associated protein Csm3 (group 7 of RAMP superfamily)
MTTLLQDLAGPGGIRPISARWVVTGQLEVVTVTHLGGGRQDAVDMALLRHPVDRTPMLPGASLAGALRSHLADRLSGYGQPEPPLVARLFGGARGDDQGGQSPLIVYDSFARLPRDVPIEIRDGVAIDAATGTAEAHKKYDAEVLPPGTRFPLRFDLVVPDSAQEQELVDALAAALQGLEAGEIGLGARRSRGWGQIKVDQWLAGRFDLTDAAGWVAWATSDHLEPWRDQPSTGCWSRIRPSRSALRRTWSA